MNCPTCGAENEADARFCAECGAPLESQTDEMVEEDDDRTIMSTVSQISEEAKTVSVTQEDVAKAAETEAEDAGFEPVIEAESPPPPPPAKGASEDNTRRYIIIAVVVLLVLCCCCLLIGIIGAASSESIEDIIDELSFIRDLSPTLLAFI